MDSLIGFKHMNSECHLFYHSILLIKRHRRIFYQHNRSRLSACPFSIHALLHIADGIKSAGPVWCYWAFAMERFCGAVGKHVKNRRNPYASLDRRARDIAQLQMIKLKYGLTTELSPKHPAVDVRGGGLMFKDGPCEFTQNPWNKFTEPNVKDSHYPVAPQEES